MRTLDMSRRRVRPAADGAEYRLTLSPRRHMTYLTHRPVPGSKLTERDNER